VSLAADPEEDAVDEGLWVVVNVLPFESVVVYMLIAPGWLVIVV
jgi:hypothetical protein